MSAQKASIKHVVLWPGRACARSLALNAVQLLSAVQGRMGTQEWKAELVLFINDVYFCA